MSKFYVTTPIYYVNDVPHVGHLYTTLAADVLARYHKLLGNDVCFLTGTDEHGAKIAQAADEADQAPSDYVEAMVPRFQEVWELMNIKHDVFMRTTFSDHERIVSDIFNKLYKNGFIYEGMYEGWYCIGCEKYLTEKELIDDKCPLHPTKKPVFQKEKNYFFKLSEFGPKLLRAIEQKKYRILPQLRANEIVSRLTQGLEDISISREEVTWGIPVLWDKKQTLYVWIEALWNYYTATRFIPEAKNFWPAQVHLMAKDITWFHAVIWPALLMAADLPLPEKIVAHGFFTVNGQKMSKSTGNVIAPKELVDMFGVDGTRYLLLAEIPFGSDADLSLERFKERYNADLANGLGNLVARVAALAGRENFQFSIFNFQFTDKEFKELRKSLENFKLDWGLKLIWEWIAKLDKQIDEAKPWKLNGRELEKVLVSLVEGVIKIGIALQPFMPGTAEKILSIFKGPKISAPAPLFPRL